MTALPDVVLLSREEAGTALLHVLADEMPVEAPGQRALLDRLLDVLLISALRTWFAGRQDEAPGWFRAHHATVAAIARQVGDRTPFSFSTAFKWKSRRRSTSVWVSGCR